VLAYWYYGKLILAPPKPKAVNVALLAIDSYDNVLKIFSIAKSNLGEILSAFEFFDRNCLDLAIKNLESRDPFDSKSPFYVLIETHGSSKEHDDLKLEGFLTNILEEKVVVDGVLAQDDTQISTFWAIREGISEACIKEGAVYKYDLSVPVSNLYSIVTETRNHMESTGFFKPNKKGEVTDVVGFGHVGDGNLHLNIIAKNHNLEIEKALEPFIYEITQKYQGSISAEHGLGLMKAPYIGYSKSPEFIKVMHNFKAVFDPKGILNPYKVFRK
jgi:FAD/FMN-containing dehydrogenase